MFERRIIEASANCGDECAQFLLAFLLQFGLMGSQNVDSAITWYHEAAKNGLPIAQYALARLLFEDEKRDAGLGWLKKAAQNNYAPAQFALGAYYEQYSGKIDRRKSAFRLIKSAADKGYLMAFPTLARMYKEGFCGKPDQMKAIAYLLKGAEKGSAICAYNVAQYFLEEGASSERIREGLNWLRDSASKLYAPAYMELSRIYSQGLYNLPKDKELADFFLNCSKETTSTSV